MNTHALSWAARHPLLAFTGLACGISWALGVVAFDARLGAPEPLADAANYAAKFGPSLAGLIMAGLVGGQAGVRALVAALLKWRVHAGWYAVALLTPLALWTLAAVLFFATSGAQPEFVISAAPAFLGLLAVRFFVGGGLGEELGWRGFLLPILQDKRGPLVASLIIGVIWGLWHAPAFYYGAGKSGGWTTLALFTLLTTALSVIFTWVYNGSRGSLLIAALLHASFNATENAVKGFVPPLDEGGTATTLYALGVLAIAVLLPFVWQPAVFRRAETP